MNSGTYEIINKETGKYYIGSSIDLTRRWKNHLCKLSNNKHSNKHLQSSYNKYGKDTFEFVVTGVYNDYREEEQILLDNIDDWTKVYNTATLVEGVRESSLNKACYLLDLKGNIIDQFKNISEISRYLDRAR